MELVHPEYIKYVYEVNMLRIKLAEVITYRDSLCYHITKSMDIDYMLKIGSLEYKLMQIRNKIEKDTRIIELSSTMKMQFDEIDSIIKKEFLEADCRVILMQEAVDRAINESRKKILSKDEVAELNSYYMPLVKDFAPEINLNNTEEEKLLFETIKDKYVSGNIAEMKKFERFEKKELYFDELENYKIEKSRIMNLMEKFNKQIIEIKNVYPYTERLELLDENLYRRKKNNINKQITEDQKVLDDLEKKIKKLKNK